MHDELVLEAPEQEIERASLVAGETMGNVMLENSEFHSEFSRRPSSTCGCDEDRGGDTLDPETLGKVGGIGEKQIG